MITMTGVTLRLSLTVLVLSTLGAAPLNPPPVTLADFPDDGLTMGPRDIHVYLPPRYAETTARYRVIYFHDGEIVWRAQRHARSAARCRSRAG